MPSRPNRSVDPLARLWRRFLRHGSAEVRNQLVEAYLPLVRSVATQLVARLPRTVERDDLQSAGVFGLVKAVEHFDPERGVRFETYCRKRVCGAMLDELRRQDAIPREARERAVRLRRTAASLRVELGRPPSDSEVAAAMGIEVEAMHDIANDAAFAAKLPLDFTLADDWSGDERSLALEPVDQLPEPPDEAYRRELIGLVHRELSHRERSIVNDYYHGDQTMKRIGSRLRLSESRVCQMHARMLSRLKRQLLSEVAP